jgi:DNA-binding NarL/FixJ family response regulator
MNINLFAVCKNDVFILAIEQTLNEEGIFISGICKNHEQAVTQYTNSKPKPDIILLDADWTFHGTTGSLLLTNFLPIAKTTKIILTTTHYEEEMITELKKLNPHGYLYKNVNSIDSIVHCIKKVYAGKPCFLSEA